MWGYGPYGMMGYGSWGLMGGTMVFWGILLVGGIVAVVWMARQRRDPSTSSERRSSGLDILQERYARGEINREEYLEKRDILARRGND